MPASSGLAQQRAERQEPSAYDWPSFTQQARWPSVPVVTAQCPRSSGVAHGGGVRRERLFGTVKADTLGTGSSKRARFRQARCHHASMLTGWKPSSGRHARP